MTASIRVQRLRALLKQHRLSAVIVPSADPHLSEYVPHRFGRREYLSGFKGSAGTAVVTADHALLWTDGRYYEQAQSELQAGWGLMKLTDLPIEQWLAEHHRDGTVAVDPTVHSCNELGSLQAHGLDVDLLSSNLVDEVWEQEEGGPPPMPDNLARAHPLEYAGQTVEEKLATVRSVMSSAGATTLIVSELDEVAWLLNIRGSDIPNCPLVLAYAIVTLERATLFCGKGKLDIEARSLLAEARVTIQPYREVTEALAVIGESVGERVMLDPARCNASLASQVSDQQRIAATSPVSHLKARKNRAELRGMEQAHRRDGAAMARFLAWLVARVERGESVSEYEIAMVLRDVRAEDPFFLGPSFDTIAGSGPNGSVVHYRPEPEGSLLVGPETGMLLLDSGGQYIDGTTDVTRCLWFGGTGSVPPYVSEAYTRV